MAENSNIEWTHHTFNPWIGCQKVGAGCDHCYAETWDARGLSGGATRWGPHADRTRTAPANWRKPLAWDRAAAQAGERHRVFCASLADVFDNHASVLPEWRADLWALIKATPNLDWMLLTKRPSNIAAMLPDDWGAGYPNVWLGCTVVNQTEADRDIPKLLSVPAHVRFLSMEPLLGPVDLTGWFYGFDKACAQCPKDEDCECGWQMRRDLPDNIAPGSIDLVIVGGESGPNARPMHPDWARSLRDQCNAAGVAFHFKQWGEWLPANQSDYLGDDVDGVRFGCWNDAGDWVDSPSWKFANAGRKVSFRVGKKTAGRELDGRTWDEMPEVSRV
jgi:protein gp37